MDDGKLLRLYVRDGSEAAFGQIVTRHRALVYGTCLRETSSPSQAEDAAQVVFLLLSRKAKGLRPGPSLAGWLFRTARFVAKDVRKQEARRQRREEIVLEELAPRPQSPAPDWQRVEPLLNGALSALRPADRELILLRFLEGLSLSETGAALGLSEDAARMRVTRAVEKMRRWLAAHGASVTSVALAGLLTAEAARPIPARAAEALPSTHVLLLSKGILHSMKIIKVKYAALAAGLLLAGATAPSLLHALSPRKVVVQRLSPSSPISDHTLSQLTIPGDYTLTYIVQRKDLLTPPQRKDPRMKAYLTWQPMTLTLSERGGKFLYRIISKNPDFGSFVMLYDGSNSFKYVFSDHRGDTYTGFYGGGLSFMPIPGARMANLPVFKNIRSLSDGNYEGEVFYPNGNTIFATGTSAYGKTRIHMENLDGTIRITKFETLGFDNTYILPTTISTFVKFKGIWIPSQMVQTIESTDQYIWTLANAKPTSEAPTFFDYHSYLRSGEIIQNDMDLGNPRVFSYTPGIDIFSQGR